MAWYPGKKLVEGTKKLKKRRKKRISENKWVAGEKLTKSGRKRATARKAGKRLKKAGVEITPAQARQSGKVRKKVVAAEVTKKGGAFPKYEKKSKAAGSFRSAFKANCAGKGAGDTFSWDGRSYSCARASDKKTKTKIGPKEYKGPAYKTSDKSPFKAKPKKMTQIPKGAKVGDKRTRKSKITKTGTGQSGKLIKKGSKRTYSFTKEQQDKAAKVVKARHESYGWRTRKEEKEGTKKKGWRRKWMEERKNK